MRAAGATRIRRAAPGDEARVAAVHVGGWRETYPGLMPPSVLDRMDAAGTARYWRGVLAMPLAEEVWLAELDGAVVGFGSCGPERAGLAGYRGEFLALYVLRRAQGRGIGPALMRAMWGSLRDRGLVPATVWTLRDNWRARAFYEKLGGRKVADRPLDFDGAVVMEVAYALTDLAPTPRGSREGG